MKTLPSLSNATLYCQKKQKHAMKQSCENVHEWCFISSFSLEFWLIRIYFIFLYDCMFLVYVCCCLLTTDSEYQGSLVSPFLCQSHTLLRCIFTQCLVTSSPSEHVFSTAAIWWGVVFAAWTRICSLSALQEDSGLFSIRCLWTTSVPSCWLPQTFTLSHSSVWTITPWSKACVYLGSVCVLVI